MPGRWRSPLSRSRAETVTPVAPMFATGLVLLRAADGRRSGRNGAGDAPHGSPPPSAIRASPRSTRWSSGPLPRSEQRYSSAGSMRAALERFGGSPALLPAAPTATGCLAPLCPGARGRRGGCSFRSPCPGRRRGCLAGALGQLTWRALASGRPSRRRVGTADAHLRTPSRGPDGIRRQGPRRTQHRRAGGRRRPDTAWSTEHYASADFEPEDGVDRLQLEPDVRTWRSPPSTRGGIPALLNPGARMPGRGAGHHDVHREGAPSRCSS
jgi:hypothetical protein